MKRIGEMEMPDLWTIIGIAVTITSLIYAIYHGIKSRQLKKLVHSQTWDLHSRANNATGAVQKAFLLYKEKYKDNLDTEVLEVFSKSAAFSQDLFLDTIRHVYLSEPFDYKTVQKWVQARKVSEEHKINFELIANLEEKPKSLYEKFKYIFG